MSNTIGGYNGKLLRVDLSDGKLTEEKLDADVLEKYMGSLGLGGYYLYKEVPAGVDAFDPENRLVLATGPLTGTRIPGSGTWSAVTKGTLTGLAAASQANGWFGARLKFAGYDAVIIQGSSPKLVYLLIRDGKAEIRDASKLAGMDTLETERTLKAELGESVSVAAIGPAGENLVKYACIASDNGHVSSTNGGGAVMGAKKLKAVVVGGKGKFPLADEARLKELAEEWVKQAKASAMGGAVNAGGTACFFTNLESIGSVPVKNLTTAVFEDHAKFTSIREQVTRVRRKACHACPLEHCNEVEVPEGPYKGLVTDEAEYESLAGFGPLIGNADPFASLKLCDVSDRLGMDSKELSFVLSLVIDLFESGKISKEDTGGLELTWGNVDAVLKLMPMIANRQGFGDLLAEGVYAVAQKLGPEANERAIYTHKGNAPHVHDPRGQWGLLFGQSVCDFGTIGGFASMELLPDPDLGYTEPVSKADPEALTESQRRMIRKYTFADCIGTCFFTSNVALDLMADVLSAVTGLSWDKEKMLELGDRVNVLYRLFNIRHGWTLEHDSHSPRLGVAPPDGGSKGYAMNQHFPKMLDQFYAAVGYDKNGHPLPATIKRLGVEA